MKIKRNSLKEIIIQDGYYRINNEVYSIQGDNAVSCFVSKDYASIACLINEYDRLDEAGHITKNEFDSQLEIAFEIIRGKLENTCPECSGTGEVDEIDKSKVNPQTITPPYHKVECNSCEGSGTKEGRDDN